MNGKKKVAPDPVVLEEYIKSQGNNGIVDVAVLNPKMTATKEANYFKLAEFDLSYDYQDLLNKDTGEVLRVAAPVFTMSVPPGSVSFMPTRLGLIQLQANRHMSLTMYGAADMVYYFLDQGSITLWDRRKESSTFGNYMTLILSNQLVYVPRRVASRIENPYKESIRIQTMSNVSKESKESKETFIFPDDAL